ncbi:unnamed protein product [Zymoseptoria tritici ST99CH_1E4]|uniref:Uncharacterized protein n=1 Tax=Zymoseptoria tritici ST99CH_1E4 TaxID=1276532 RepID=A0A2H1H538_ZYMTR|nr:unnamed protein product [Zymoseptoria tritici ST99CH_1E4]
MENNNAARPQSQLRSRSTNRQVRSGAATSYYEANNRGESDEEDPDETDFSRKIRTSMQSQQQPQQRSYASAAADESQTQGRSQEQRTRTPQPQSTTRVTPNAPTSTDQRRTSTANFSAANISVPPSKRDFSILQNRIQEQEVLDDAYDAEHNTNTGAGEGQLNFAALWRYHKDSMP